MSKVVVISVHPDDETLGCGGTLLKHKMNNDEIFWVIITKMGKNQSFNDECIAQRQIEIEEVGNKLGISRIYKLDFPAVTLSDELIPEIISKVSEVFKEKQPEILYLPNRSDAHSDHRVAFEAIMSCTKSFRHPYLNRILMCECISETEFAPPLPENMFIPNYFVDITKTFEEKLQIMQIYESEIGEHPFPRSLRNIEALAVHRGATVGVEYAEAFQMLKYIDK